MRAKRLTKGTRLRLLLADGEWHSNSALVRAGCGYRYGSLIEAARKGRDGWPPVSIETRRVTSARWEYRLRPNGLSAKGSA